jgi:excisionase family DNA binding protein
VLIDQAMQLLGVSRRTVYYWIRQGRLRTVRTRLGSQRVLLDSIREMETMPAAPPPAAAGVSGSLSS